MSTDISVKNCITLKASAQIIAEYLKYGINSILFQRGIYPPETFENTQKYGLTILLSKNKQIEEYLDNVLRQTQEWLSKNFVRKIAVVISNVRTEEVLERWDFMVEALPGDGPTGDGHEPKSSKELKRIQNEIRDVMRQISSTVSYLPLLESVCTFEIMVYTQRDFDVPELWDETTGVNIPNAQVVGLRSFSTGLHKVDTVVNYKLGS